MEWILGIGFVVAAGAMQGGFPLPLKFTRHWEWENLWVTSSLLGLVIFPWMIAAWTIPDLAMVLRSSPPASVAQVWLFGMGWGVGGLLFGLGVHRVGLSITLGVVIGLTSSIGCVVPLALYHPDRLLQTTGLLVIAAVVVTLIGLLLCALAGLHRERQLPPAVSEAPVRPFRRGSYWAGIAICVLSGVLSPLFNFALIRGEDLMRTAVAHGARAVDSPNLIWAVAMTGGMIPTALYCFYVMSRRGTWKRFSGPSTIFDGSLAIAMGALFAVGNALYGMGAESLGNIGAILGWPIFMAVQVMTGSILGFATGEWRGATRTTIRYLVAGNVALMAAVFLIGRIGP